MPNNIRAGLSVVVALVAIGVFFWEAGAGPAWTRWFALGFGALLIGAVWLFPEAKGMSSRKRG